MKKSTPIWKTLNPSDEMIRLAKAEKAKRLRKRQLKDQADEAKRIALQPLQSLESDPDEAPIEAIVETRNLLPEPYGLNTPEALIAFTFECAETCLELSGAVREIPPKVYIAWTLREWWQCTQTGRHSLHWKPRRMIVSWLAAIYDVWDLLQHPGKVRVAALIYDGDKGAKAFVWRRWFVYERLRKRFPEWNLPPSKADGSIESGELKSVTFPNGGRVSAVNSHPSSFRGSGARRVWTEELNEYALVNKAWKEACVVCQAPPGEIGGTAFAIVNAGTNLEYQEIKKRGDAPILEGPIDGCQSWISESGVLILDLAYRADPEKTPEWAAEASQGIPALEWQIEMEKNEDVFEGQPVFPNFLYEQHAPAGFRDSEFPLLEKSIFIGGWDCGQTKQPAFALVQLTEGGQILWMFEVVAKVPMPMRLFAPLVRQTLMEKLPGHWMRVRHVGDPTGGTKLKNWATGETEEYSAFDIAHQVAGFVIQASVNNPTVRQDAVHWMLMSWADRTGEDKDFWMPRTYYCEKSCPTLVRGMKGAYQWTVTQVGGGATYREPKKDFYSHVNDAHQYAAIECFRELHNGALPEAGNWAAW